MGDGVGTGVGDVVGTGVGDGVADGVIAGSGGDVGVGGDVQCNSVRAQMDSRSPYTILRCFILTSSLSRSLEPRVWAEVRWIALYDYSIVRSGIQ